MDEARSDQEPVPEDDPLAEGGRDTKDSTPEDDPLAECIRDGIYTVVGLGLLAVNRVQVARRDLAGQMPDELRDAFADLADQVPEDVRNAVADLTSQIPDSLRQALADVVEQAPAIADALREFVNRDVSD